MADEARVAVQHRMTVDGESTEKWALREPDFFGSIKRFLNCGRCGGLLGPKRYDEPRHVRELLKPTMHFLCDECYEALP